MNHWLKNRKTGKPFIQRVGNEVENKWQNSTPMPLASKSSRLCQGCKKNVAVRTTEEDLHLCERCYDLDSQVSGGETAPEPYESVLEESPDLIGESAMDRGEDKMTHSLMDDERQSERLQGARAILGDLFAPTKPTNTPPKSKKETEE